jgi:hypothetical protein
VFPLAKVNAITSSIMLATATHIVLDLATLGNVTQIGLFLFISLRQSKYNMCRCCRHYRRRYCGNFRQWKRSINNRVSTCLPRRRRLAGFFGLAGDDSFRPVLGAAWAATFLRWAAGWPEMSSGRTKARG